MINSVYFKANMNLFFTCFRKTIYLGLIICCSFNLSASICYGLEASTANTVTVSVTADQDYSALPTPNSTWTTGAFTLCWSSDTGTPTILSASPISTLPFLADAGATQVGNETCQIYAFIGPVLLDMAAGESIPVFELVFACADCSGDVLVNINESPAMPVVNGDSSIINFFGEEFGASSTCVGSASLSLGASVSASLNAKVFFEGYYNGSTLNTASNAGGILVTSQPYNVSPDNYAGNESVSSFASDIVDWVLVELRDANDETNVVEKKAGLIKANGDIVDASGSGPLLFNSVAGDYFIVIRHRGHVAIMSANSVSLPNANLDLTTSSGDVKGTDQTKLSNGAYVMRAGDYNGNGTVNFQDFILWLSNNNVFNSYLFFDGDGNGTINFSDFILWLGNNNHLAYPGI